MVCIYSYYYHIVYGKHPWPLAAQASGCMGSWMEEGLNNSTNPVQAVQAKLLGHTPYTSKVSIHCASVRSMSTMYNQPHPQKQVQQGTPSIFRQDSTIDQ